MTRILIVNQHGSNRGDEAACRAMIYGLRRFIPDAEIDIQTVYPIDLGGIDRIRTLDNLTLRGLRGLRAIRGAIRYLIGFYTGLGCTSNMKDVFSLMRRADLIVSAPGGPYIGDLYPWTEKELAFHVLLATLTRNPVMIYAPSAGPFSGTLSNRWRRLILNRVDLITVRESFSASYLSDLGINLPSEFITADSALQRPVQPGLGSRIFTEESLDPDRMHIGYVPLDLGRFRDDLSRMRYIELLVKSLHQLAERFDPTVVLFPQGYEAWHDRPFMEFISGLTDLADRIHVLPETYNSDQQQALVGEMDAFVSFRYHPAIFAVRQFVPCVAVAYEHKVRGFMRAIGMDEFCLDLETVTASNLVAKVEQAWDQREGLTEGLRSRIESVERDSLRTSFLASLLLSHRSRQRQVALKPFVRDQLSAEWWKLPPGNAPVGSTTQDT